MKMSDENICDCDTNPEGNGFGDFEKCLPEWRMRVVMGGECKVGFKNGKLYWDEEDEEDEDDNRD